MKYLINVDKLKLNFKTDKEITEIKNEIMLSLTTNYILTKATKNIDNNYTENLVLTDHKGQDVLTFKLRQRQQTDFNAIAVNKAILYNNYSTFLDVYTKLQKEFDIIVDSLEIAIDTNINILKRFKKIKNVNLSEYYRKLDVRDLTFMEENNLTERYYNNHYRTIYIQKTLNKNSTVNKQKSKSNSLRIENKSECLKRNECNYISNLHNTYLDKNKDVYRLELIYKNTSSNQVIYLKDIDDLTDYKDKRTIDNYIKRLAALKEQRETKKEVFNSSSFISTDKEYLKLQKIVSQYDVKSNRRTYDNIKVDRLKDSDYLSSLFVDKASKIIDNLDNIIKIKKGKNMKANKIERVTITKERKSKEDKEYNNYLENYLLAKELAETCYNKMQQHKDFDSSILQNNSNTLDSTFNFDNYI